MVTCCLRPVSPGKASEEIWVQKVECRLPEHLHANESSRTKEMGELSCDGMDTEGLASTESSVADGPSELPPYKGKGQIFETPCHWMWGVALGKAAPSKSRQTPERSSQLRVGLCQYSKRWTRSGDPGSIYLVTTNAINWDISSDIRHARIWKSGHLQII